MEIILDFLGEFCRMSQVLKVKGEGRVVRDLMTEEATEI